MKLYPVMVVLSALMVSASAWSDENLETVEAADVVICEAGSADLCYDAALDLHYGKGVTKDKAAAHKIFANLCERGMGKACHAAAMNFSRYSANPDFEKSLYYQSIGCDAGVAQSCHVMGRNLEGPWATDRKADHENAKIYFLKACDLGFGLSCGYAEVPASGHRLQ